MERAFWRVLRRLVFVFAGAATAALTLTLVASANLAVLIIATDPFTNSTSQHATIVEPDTYSFGNTIVAAAQWGRFTDGGASDIGVSVSTNNGTSWTAQQLPGITSTRPRPARTPASATRRLRSMRPTTSGWSPGWRSIRA